MSGPEPEIPRAEVRLGRSRRFSLIWLIPTAIGIVGAYVAVDTLASRGPVVRITFRTAQGLQAGKSVVKEKEVEMGTVKSVAVSDDNQSVVATVEMRPGAARLLNETTRFWVVKPRFFAGAVSGLDTLLSGSYLELRTDKVDDGGQRNFDGLDEPPVLQSDTPGRTFIVHADRVGSLSLGSPVFYRDIQVGQLLGYDLADMARQVTLHVFIREPFDQYVHADTLFWNASGFSATLGSSGLQVQVESLRAILLGGIAFSTPDGGKPLGPGEDAGKFQLFKDQEASVASSFGRQIDFLAYFTGSVRGLVVGAEVELRGIRIGQVTDVRLQYDPQTDQIVVPVRFTVQPDRIAQNNVSADVPGYMADLIHRGLRAQLASGNLITGAQLVSLDIVPDAPPAEMRREGGAIVVPTLKSGGFENLARSASDILAKVNALPFEEIGKHLDETLANVDKATAGPQLGQAVASLNEALASVRDVAAKLDAGLKPTLDRLPQIAKGIEDSVARANKLISGADTGYGGDSRIHQELADTLGQLSDAARSIKALADLLARHPEALIRGRTDRGVE